MVQDRVNAVHLLPDGFGFCSFTDLVPEQTGHRRAEDDEHPGVDDGVGREEKKGDDIVSVTISVVESIVVNLNHKRKRAKDECYCHEPQQHQMFNLLGHGAVSLVSALPPD